MKVCNHFDIKTAAVLLFSLLCFGQSVRSQQTGEPEGDFKVKSPFHNQLFFNRFLINPTFSLVRENKSYLNILHRNQYATYEDNIQNYYLGFSNKLNERTALGIGVYGQWEGVVQEFGFNANYATAVRLGDKSKLTFGTNITYVSQGLARNRIVTPETDPTLEESTKESKISVQPGVALSVGRFDVALYGKDLIRYNQTTNELLTGFEARNLHGALQYTQPLGGASGLFENGRLMPLVQVGMDAEDRIAYIGSLLLDLPNYGWVQTTYDATYGLSMGLGFNLNQKLSLGYLMEKDLSDTGSNLGWNHELSLAYTFKDDEDNGEIFVDAGTMSKDKQIDAIVRNYEDQLLELRAARDADAVVSEQSLAWENRMILDELMMRQDSIEEARTALFEQKFESLVRTIRNEIRNQDQTPERVVPPAGRRNITTAVAAAETRKPAAPEPYKPVAKRDFKELPIRAKNRSDIVGVSSGYYLIANVYKNKKYLNAFVKSLKEKGLDARQFYNTENGLYYVYLADFSSKGEADMAHHTDLSGKYQDEKWIMEVYNPVATAEVSFQEE
ncbi:MULTISPECIES: PorP/SprF family type IX secretion system membrane protein [unclassified Robiginitalea]|uniref:PorP/SprF family type IX secretion system membrane protein n=1 Tax=Robiginitalea TaxID=252306 RepID=UPI00234BA0FB|nr:MULTISPECIES: PorP/SprF family type IX secretion system membrane protein [unclassified Robiginitalea]MDC6353925.1 PorP/SprF family type IX secretion system membrane protein [Robiginitalea sp. PM2]MDC6374192.1 PorP/SprF family type IX secretion system membrane protein [Robiginitalea sp. SP8]